MTTISDTIDREIDEAYTTDRERAAYRAGMSSAAAVCDQVARETWGRGRRKTEQSAVAALCGDRIWELRARITTST